MTTIRFNASQVEIVPETGFIGFTDEDTQHYLYLQPTETSTGFSANKSEIWIERDDQIYGGTGGNWSIILTPTSFFLHIEEMPWMKCDAVDIRFSVDADKYAGMRSLIATVMRDCPDDLTLEES